MINNIITASEAALILGITPKSIREMCRDNKLKCRQTPDGVWLITRKSVESYRDNKKP